jgi:hypothetical protein
VFAGVLDRTRIILLYRVSILGVSTKDVLIAEEKLKNALMET